MCRQQHRLRSQEKSPCAVAAASTGQDSLQPHLTPKPREKQADSREFLALDAAGLAQGLGVSVRHIRRLNAAGKLPRPVRLGRLVRWAADEIRDWLAAGCPDRQSWQAAKNATAGVPR